MAQLVYSTLNSSYSSTQSYLGSVLLCPSCKGQKPKGLFKVIDGESVCKDCQDEIELETKEL
jgi:hypothetical protein